MKDNIKNYVEHLFFVEHEIDMKNYLPLIDSKLIDDLVQMTIYFSDKSIDEYKREISLDLCDKFKSEITGIIYNTINKKDIKKVEIDDL